MVERSRRRHRLVPQQLFDQYLNSDPRDKFKNRSCTRIAHSHILHPTSPQQGRSPKYVTAVGTRLQDTGERSRWNPENNTIVHVQYKIALAQGIKTSRRSHTYCKLRAPGGDVQRKRAPNRNPAAAISQYLCWQLLLLLLLLLLQA